MKKSELFAAGLVAVLIIGSGIVGVWSKSQPQAAAAAQGFDHSNCQYPDRWTNPANGCDNSDPAVPECIKAAYSQQAEADCIAAFTAQHQPITPVTELLTVTPAPTKAECGGK